MSDESPGNDLTRATEVKPCPIVVQAKQLFGERREIVIEYEGERYKLRITRRGKLILQK